MQNVSLSRAFAVLTLVFIPSIIWAKSTVEFPLTQAVKWQLISNEYQLITSSLYTNAAATLNQKKLLGSNWVVVMDVDETLLDNSEYQRRLNISGKTYTVKSWSDWVKEESAIKVPGALDFVNAVLEKGGKLVFITNRPKSLDNNTWANLKSAGYPITFQNTCLMGRSKKDKTAINHTSVVNDKDLRRNLLLSGRAECFSASGVIPKDWHSSVTIEMQVGDNIEDINHTTQENANVSELMKRQGNDILILPNAIYGSWN